MDFPIIKWYNLEVDSIKKLLHNSNFFVRMTKQTKGKGELQWQI